MRAALGLTGAASLLLALASLSCSSSTKEVVRTVVVTATPAPESTLSASPQAQVAATPTQPPAAPTQQAPAALPDRTSCDEIRGTDYRSESEHAWYLANCTAGTTASQPTASTASTPYGGGAPPASQSSGLSSSSRQEEAAYRNRASAQLAYLDAQMVQFMGTPSYGALNDLLTLGGIVQSFASAIDNLAPVPPRFKAVHDNLRKTSLDVHDQILLALQVTTESQFYHWLDGYLTAVDDWGNALDDYNLVVGLNLPKPPE